MIKRQRTFTTKPTLRPTIMHNAMIVALTTLTLALTACSPKQDSAQLPAEGASESQERAQETESNSSLESAKNTVLDIPATEENLKKGEIVFLRCRSCHTLDSEGIHLTGPNLHGLFGAKAGQKDGYAYSEALKESNLIWNEATLSAWFENPQGVIKGNIMAFPGLPDEANRHALIAYLRANTAD